jgi:hypothetical protein
MRPGVQGVGPSEDLELVAVAVPVRVRLQGIRPKLRFFRVRQAVVVVVRVHAVRAAVPVVVRETLVDPAVQVVVPAVAHLGRARRVRRLASGGDLGAVGCSVTVGVGVDGTRLVDERLVSVRQTVPVRIRAPGITAVSGLHPVQQAVPVGVVHAREVEDEARLPGMEIEIRLVLVSSV